MLYRELIPPQIHVLDLMPLWVSHLPKDASYEHVSGLVMNEQEFASNPQLDDYFALNLNKRPKISMRGEIFDFVVNSASVQYLTRLGQVFASASRMLRLSGRSIVDYSHSRFPTKAVAIWQQLSRDNRARLGSSYHVISGSFDESFFLDRSPENAAPLWVVIARKATHSNLPIFTQPRPTRKFLSAREFFAIIPRCISRNGVGAYTKPTMSVQCSGKGYSTGHNEARGRSKSCETGSQAYAQVLRKLTHGSGWTRMQETGHRRAGGLFLAFASSNVLDRLTQLRRKTPQQRQARALNASDIRRDLYLLRRQLKRLAIDHQQHPAHRFKDSDAASHIPDGPRSRAEIHIGPGDRRMDQLHRRRPARISVEGDLVLQLTPLIIVAGDHHLTNVLPSFQCGQPLPVLTCLAAFAIHESRDHRPRLIAVGWQPNRSQHKLVPDKQPHRHAVFRQSTQKFPCPIQRVHHPRRCTVDQRRHLLRLF
jgi:hypothetical protein